MENKMFVSKNDRQDWSLTSQVCDQAGHCPLAGRYFQPFTNKYCPQMNAALEKTLHQKCLKLN